jgi:hypothetical protein
MRIFFILSLSIVIKVSSDSIVICELLTSKSFSNETMVKLGDPVELLIKGDELLDVITNIIHHLIGCVWNPGLRIDQERFHCQMIFFSTMVGVKFFKILLSKKRKTRSNNKSDSFTSLLPR